MFEWDQIRTLADEQNAECGRKPKHNIPIVKQAEDCGRVYFKAEP